MFFGGLTIDINGFSLVFGFCYHCFQWFSMVPDHWSNDAMVSMDRCCLFQIIFNVVFLYSSIRWDRLRLSEVGLVASVENTPSPLDPHFNDGTQKVSEGPYNICHGHCPLTNNL